MSGKLRVTKEELTKKEEEVLKINSIRIKLLQEVRFNIILYPQLNLIF